MLLVFSNRLLGPDIEAETMDLDLPNLWPAIKGELYMSVLKRQCALLCDPRMRQLDEETTATHFTCTGGAAAEWHNQNIRQRKTFQIFTARDSWLVHSFRPVIEKV